ncbi:MAG: PrsW family intramembrane metalloprotease [Nocardiopsaceae bacterium]|nr:PrsW family intramembrane metalloprotease [Nocardiopsaceae bacterium]
MAEPPPLPDRHSVIDGRAPGMRKAFFYAGVALTSACGILALFLYLAESVRTGHSAAPFAAALPLAILPVPLLLAGVLWVDRLEPEPRGNLVFAFAWGAGIAALVALLVNTAGLEYVTQPALGATAGEFVSATFGAPLVEESLKGAVLVGLLRWRRAEFDGPTDGIVYAAMVGLGFAMLENVGYYINALDSPVRGGVALLGFTFVLRGVLSPLMHPMFTAMTGLGVARAARRRRGGGRVVAIGWLGAVALHMTWNGLSSDGVAGVGIGYLVMLAVLAVLIVILVVDRRKLVRHIRSYLLPYEPTGLVRAEDVGMLGSLRTRHLARNWARLSGGVRAGIAMTDYQLAATELALLHDKVSRGVLAEPEFARRKHDLLTLMHTARAAVIFLHRGPLPSRPAPWAPSGRTTFKPGDPPP